MSAASDIGIPRMVASGGSRKPARSQRMLQALRRLRSATDTLKDAHNTDTRCALLARAHLVQVDAPEVEALGEVAQDALKDAAAAVRAAPVELNQRSLAQHLRQPLNSISCSLLAHCHLRGTRLCATHIKDCRQLANMLRPQEVLQMNTVHLQVLLLRTWDAP